MTASLVATAQAVNLRAVSAADGDCSRCHHQDVTTIGDRIEEAREKKGWSQRELARQAGKNESEIGVLVRRLTGDSPGDVQLGTLRKIADACEVSLWWLISGEGPRDASGYAVVYDARYPNLEKALAPLIPDLRPKTPARIRSTTFASYRDLSVLEWTRHILAEDERVRFEEEHGAPEGSITKEILEQGAKDHPDLPPPPAKWPGGRRPKKP